MAMAQVPSRVQRLSAGSRFRRNDGAWPIRVFPAPAALSLKPAENSVSRASDFRNFWREALFRLASNFPGG
jgi:hypothetical protein